MKNYPVSKKNNNDLHALTQKTQNTHNIFATGICYMFLFVRLFIGVYRYSAPADVGQSAITSTASAASKSHPNFHIQTSTAQPPLHVSEAPSLTSLQPALLPPSQTSSAQLHSVAHHATHLSTQQQQQPPTQQPQPPPPPQPPMPSHQQSPQQSSQQTAGGGGGGGLMYATNPYGDSTGYLQMALGAYLGPTAAGAYKSVDPYFLSQGKVFRCAFTFYIFCKLNCVRMIVYILLWTN